MSSSNTYNNIHVHSPDTTTGHRTATTTGVAGPSNHLATLANEYPVPTVVVTTQPICVQVYPDIPNSGQIRIPANKNGVVCIPPENPLEGKSFVEILSILLPGHPCIELERQRAKQPDIVKKVPIVRRNAEFFEETEQGLYWDVVRSRMVDDAWEVPDQDPDEEPIRLQEGRQHMAAAGAPSAPSPVDTSPIAGPSHPLDRSDPEEPIRPRKKRRIGTYEEDASGSEFETAKEESSPVASTSARRTRSSRRRRRVTRPTTAASGPTTIESSPTATGSTAAAESSSAPSASQAGSSTENTSAAPVTARGLRIDRKGKRKARD